MLPSVFTLYPGIDSRTVATSGTAAHNDIGIDLDVNSASLGTSSLIGMDIDVTGAASGTSTATGLTVDVGSADTNYALITSGGNVGIATAAPASMLHVTGDVQVGVDDTGHDVKFFGATSGKLLHWDESADELILAGTMKFKEQADAHSDTAAYGQLWVNTATPNELYFTDDAGTDFNISGKATTGKAIAMSIVFG